MESNYNMKSRLLIIINVVIILFGWSMSQTVIINEVMSANSTIISDEDGDYSDWIELYNYGESPVNLGGFALSDDVDEPDKWILPDFQLNPNQYLLIFASGKNRSAVSSHWETVINWGDDWKYILGYSAPPELWRQTDFIDDNWPTGPSGFGYGDGDDATITQPIISVFIRNTFNIESLASIQQAVLHVDYDDAFVAYLNGVEIARANIGTPGVYPSYDQGSDSWREALMYSGGLPESFSDDWAETLLQEGQNTLAIEVHNYNSTSSDLSLIPFFTLGMNEIPENPNGTPEILDFQMTPLHTNFNISSDGETLILTSADGITLDSLETGDYPVDISFGRYPDGEDSWMIFTEPTPGSENSDIGYSGLITDPIFSNPGGFYDNTITLSISSDSPSAVMYYTVDGSEPTENSYTYTNPFNIYTTAVIRARSFQPGFMPSNTITHSYFVNEDTPLTVMSLSTTPDNFFDFNTGIYEMGPNASQNFPHFGANFWQDWERPIHIELFEIDRQLGFSSDAGVKIFGGWSRGLPQKSMSFFARSEYGASQFNYQLFDNLSIDIFESFIIRNSGNDWESSMLRDGMMTTLVQNEGVDLQAYRPAAVYLNGQYWGLYNIREKINEHFIASHHPVDPDDLDILEADANPINGDAGHYNSMINFLNSENMSLPENYDYITTQMDIDEFISYEISQIYYDNQDWPGNNIKFWRPRTDDGKWRWILYDTDFGFGIWNSNAYANNTLAFALNPWGPGWPNPPWSTFLLRKLLENPVFENKFINRFCDLYNTIFDADYVLDHISDIMEVIEPEMPDHINRWGGSMSEWYSRIGVINNFANQRLGYMMGHFMSEFDLDETGQIILGITIPNSGQIKINSLTLDSYPWQGTYFQGVDIELTALPANGYTFSGWSANYGANPTIYVAPQNVLSITAYFNPIPGYQENIVINEINYNSSPDADTGDWIEFYNNSPNPINIGGWQFKDSNDENVFTIPENTYFQEDSYFLLARDTEALQQFFPDVDNIFGQLDFGFSGAGELLRLFNQFGVLADSVRYDDIEPWPLLPDGDGPTLELNHPNMNNGIGENWSASVGFGTPGAINSVDIQTCQYNGDANLDGDISVLDIVLLIGHILGDFPLENLALCNADVINDGTVDVLDVVALVGLIID
ncbi:MAG: hypothetical protein HN729_05755 [Candidatus Marinimicrobia bacterium]|jgi:hypothetical protein|nr:hypothetical protein [Candidatus Neomarinimicrobiota bacterium]MBT3634719.1 hypothetical protein [Candidatus Neomarinimicrobiota bacterium]MBT3683440.1 hypothetical protein [Candidatus Neomarinimicrobiota bacterium]MBT3760371.1 hypothetical protein [Candidatus Neomarinimicrobiota bacterium]MBT3896551.1 hypothetical protein [Candidatus Neomarinimicrobiota bacterium]